MVARRDHANRLYNAAFDALRPGVDYPDGMPLMDAAYVALKDADLELEKLRQQLIEAHARALSAHRVNDSDMPAEFREALRLPISDRGLRGLGVLPVLWLAAIAGFVVLAAYLGGKKIAADQTDKAIQSTIAASTKIQLQNDYWDRVAAAQAAGQPLPPPPTGLDVGGGSTVVDKALGVGTLGILAVVAGLVLSAWKGRK